MEDTNALSKTAQKEHNTFWCTERKSTLFGVSCGCIKVTKIGKSKRGYNFTHIPPRWRRSPYFAGAVG